MTMPLFSNYGFAVIVLQWSGIRCCPGVGALVMDGDATGEECLIA